MNISVNIILPKNIYLLLSLLMGLVLASCNSTKHLAPGKVLYTGSEITFETEQGLDNLPKLREDLLAIIRPQPNAQIFGWRPKLWVYNHLGKKKSKGLGASLRKRFAKAPVLLDTAQARLNTLRIEKHLQDEGYFHSKASYRVDRKPKKPKAQVIYSIGTRGRYIIKELLYPNPDDPVRKIIHEEKAKSLIQIGNPYLLSVLQAERQRISGILSNEGYANFTPAYLYYTLDTLSGSHEVRIRMHLKDASDSSGHRKYFISNIYVYPDFTLDPGKQESQASDTLLYENLVFTHQALTVRPKILQQNILLRKGEKYSLKNHQFTHSHLQELGVYKFVNIKYLPDPLSPGSDSLHAFLYLTPRPMKEIGVSLEQDSRTGLFSGFGTNLSLTYTHRNLFKGAELLNVSLKGAVILQPGDSSQLVNSVDFTARVDLYVPRFLVPLRINNVSRFYLPKTRTSLNFSYQERIGFYTLGNFGLSFGYQWKENPRIQHEFTPFSILNTQLLSSTTEFNDLLAANPSLLRSFSNTFIIGPKYAYTVQQAPAGYGEFYHYFRFSMDLAGNLLQLASRLSGPNTEPNQILGRPFAQFSLLKGEYRTYYPLSKGQMLAFRFSGGLGIPYGNSQELPYIRQFFIGGPVSIRAFRIRTLGPGSYSSDNSQSEVDYVDQSGDISLETSLEYRFPLVNYLKGALFLDAGNIWLMPKKSQIGFSVQEQLRYDQGVFNKNFANQIAIGAGIGMRLDLDIFVLRLDMATPLRIPSNDAGDRWAIRRIQPFYGPWLKEPGNVVVNVAIGYPF